MQSDPAGGATEIVGSWSDVTQRKQLEEQFRQAQKMEAIGRLAGGVAHDFNNLLTIINGYGTLVLTRLPADDPTREMIREVVAAGDRAAGLTRQLLAFSRKAFIEPRVLDLKVLVGDLQKMLRRIIGEDIQLTVASDPDLGAVNADLGQIEQVIMNLVVNARDAMQGGVWGDPPQHHPPGGQLTIELRNRDLDETSAREQPEARAGPYVVLTVRDTGCGMDAAPSAGRPAGRSARRRAGPGSSSPFSPPRGKRAPDWGWPRSMASSSRAAATSPSPARWGPGRPSRCTCRACSNGPRKG